MLSKEYTTLVTISREKALSKEECITKVKKFRYEYEVSELSVSELASKLIEGYMVIPCEMESHKKEGFVSSSLIFVDIDTPTFKSTEVVSLLSKRGFTPSIGYYTYSSTHEQERYRLVFLLSEVIEDKDTYQQLIYGLHEVLNSIGIETDRQTRDLNRVSFGGKGLFHQDTTAFVDVANIPFVETAREIAPSKQMSLDIETGYEIVEMLKRGDWEGLQQTVSVTLPDDFEKLTFIEKLNSISVREFFQLPSGNMSCFFHEDNKPSVGVIHTGKNELYHCFSCGEKLNLVSLIGKLINGTVHDAIQALELVLGVKFGTAYQERMLKVAHQHKRQLRSQLESDYPELYSWMERSNLTGFYLALIDIGTDLVTDQPLNSENDLTFFVSLRALEELFKPFSLTGAKDKNNIGKKITLLSEVGLVVKESDIKEQSYIAKAHAYKQSKGYRYRTNYLTIPMDADVLSQANQMVVQRKQSGVRNSFTSSTQTFNHDPELAGKVYSQSDMGAIERAVRQEQELLLQLGMQLIEEHGYFSDKTLSEKLQELGYKKFKADKMAGTYRPFLMSYFDLVTLSSVLIEEKGLPAHLKPRQKIYLQF